jgi:hypothetical protein
VGGGSGGGGTFPLTSILSREGERKIKVMVLTGDCFVLSFLAMTGRFFLTGQTEQTE